MEKEITHKYVKYILAGAVAGILYSVLHSKPVRHALLSALIGAICLPTSELISELPQNRILKAILFGFTAAVLLSVLTFFLLQPEEAFLIHSFPIFISTLIAGFFWKYKTDDLI